MTTKGINILKLGLNISLEAIFDIYINKINIPPKNTKTRV